MLFCNSLESLDITMSASARDLCWRGLVMDAETIDEVLVDCLRCRLLGICSRSLSHDLHRGVLLKLLL